MHAYILIDRSGSMASRWDETLGAINGYVEALADDTAKTKNRVTVALFDGNDPFEIIREDVKADKWKALSAKDAVPRGMTPLFDAIGSLVTLIEKKAPKRASVVIVTDGAENASQEMTKEAAKARLDTMRKAGYDVVFLGADFDNMGQGADLGNQRGQTISMAEGSYDSAMAVMAKRARKYASSGEVVEFSEADRDLAAGKKTR